MAAEVEAEVVRQSAKLIQLPFAIVSALQLRVLYFSEEKRLTPTKYFLG
jgi:hypothetical protein